ncbi:zinc transporter ZntB [Stakelama tenebrarum]|uniref:Zinc transporter ZntB n=1 Tax=Stakelama tenebrarum TaxID=2711215 RepID=A0A6G6Y533_9SPHN|nr:zinc transporter ZntB [Sphingosinithalassobacter tenebrarum]QIG80042.1 zinc transporter ZntB [Sphingosinithalassobacter tenebrarum]
MAPQGTDDPTAADPDTGLIFARVLDGRGGAATIGWEEARHWMPREPQETLWMHVDRTVPCVDDWLQSELGLSEATADALTADETRPRAFREGDALVAVLRGINFNPNAEPEDMVSLRMWARGNRVLTLRRRPLQTPSEIAETLDRGKGPKRTGDLVTEIIEQLVTKIGSTIVDMNDKIDELEDGRGDHDTDEILTIIATIRRNCLGLKRHMSPQHEALLQVSRESPEWMSENNSRDIRETIDRLKRYLEDLDVSKESALVLQDDINNRAANLANHRVYLLTIAAGIFLPLSFVTALLGVNLGGIPGMNDPNGFWILTGILLALTALQLLVFRLLKWI